MSARVATDDEHSSSGCWRGPTDSEISFRQPSALTGLLSRRCVVPPPANPFTAGVVLGRATTGWRAHRTDARHKLTQELFGKGAARAAR